MPVELLVSRYGGRLWTALREDGRTVELRVAPVDDRPRAGRILKTRVRKILPGMQAAFVDLGGERDGFLHASELPLKENRSPTPPIQDRLREGEVLIVQVQREEQRHKGARVSCRLSIPGRGLVLVPGNPGVAVSRRIPDRQERKRLADLLERLPSIGSGWIARTAAGGKEFDALAIEARALEQRWQSAQLAAESMRKLPCVVLPEPDLLSEVLRELPAEGLERIVVDDVADRQQLLDLSARYAPEFVAAVSLHPRSDPPLFESTGVATEIERALRTRVWLRSGGYLVIEETEALVSIDVNTGKNTGKSDLERTVLKTNLEAAAEVPRQLRLRGLGGIVVVDMIDMEQDESRQAVLDRFREALRSDPARTRVKTLEEFGLISLTRKITRASLAILTSRQCPTCRGSGRSQLSG